GREHGMGCSFRLRVVNHVNSVSRLSIVRQKREGCDVVVAGAGVAGLSAALAAADSGASVLVLAKASHRSSNSYAAQGGVAAAVGSDDDPVLHAADTLADLRGSAVVLATGGYAALWARTTNPRGAIGDGLLLARAAGAALADLELVQFHPTALRDENGPDGFLLSEALRGAGATLLDDGGRRFVDELAPRDVVARAVGARAGTHL